MSPLIVIALVLFLLGNAVALVRCIQTNSWPDPLFLVVDSVVVLYVLTGVVK